MTYQPPIGILGGTFDPIHIGHLRPAIEAKDTLGLASIRLIPNYIPPHKPQPHANAVHRRQMVGLAAAHTQGFVLDDRELVRPSASYTIDTLIELRAELPTTPLCFLMGMDSLLTLRSWHRWRELLDYAHLVVSVRPDWEAVFDPDIAAVLEEHQTANPRMLTQSLAGYIYLQHNTPIPLSATALRLRFANGQDTQYLLPDPVINYIHQYQLYSSV